MFDGFFRRLIARHDASGLRAFLADDASELARIDVGDSHRVALLQEITE